ncbi:DinB family protein [Flagellimonas sp. 389]|uniref:DinB family protein n=1 Tax=Flagellimonas sp. 389 TaxID=2835862 RepID=UPI001BD56641|nr:DinB family protein [Flagellimonas sp. 389]MBS9463389.1 DinB family protein [Flagellimonas sp. 389]
MTIQQLNENEFNPYYGRYIHKLSNTMELRKGFSAQRNIVIDFFLNIPKAKLDFRYGEDKWTVKEVFQHLIDTERIFMYRCFRIARRDQLPLAGFDQNIYIAPSGTKKKSIEALVAEFTVNRENSVVLLNSLTNDDLMSIGNADGNAMSARAAAFTILGHEIWHMEIVKEKYL